MSSPDVSRRQALRTIAGSAAVAMFGAAASSVWPSGIAWAEGTEPLTELRAGGLAVLLRHARTTAGSGDPPGYRLDDCATQRNLDDAGRAQARRVGQMVREERADAGARPELTLVSDSGHRAARVRALR